VTTEADIVTPEAADPTGSHGLRYKPALTGVRFFGIVFVMLYHANISWSRGGVFALDMFFMLSGFLITTLLVSEMTETGTLRLGHFWSRRAKRLLPALFLLIGSLAVYAVFFGTPDEIARLRSDGIATLLYVSNWWYAFSGASYFDNFQPSLLRHTWSLSMEEQFYVFWPLLFIAGYKWLKGNLELLAALAFIGALASAGLMWFMFDPDGDPSRVYYGTDTRVQALLVGVALALISRGNTRRFISERWIQLGGWIGYGIFAVIVAKTAGSQPWIYRGGFLMFSLVSAVIIFAHAGDDKALLNRIFGCKPMVLLGSLTYGAYLWQWPVFIVVDEARVGIGGLPLLAIQFVVTFAFAAVSYYLVETPIRRSSFSFRTPGATRTYAIGVAGAAALVVVMFLATTTIFGPNAQVSASVSAGARRILVTGDSTGATLVSQYPGTGDLNVEGATILGCGIVRGDNKLSGQPIESTAPCNAWPQKWADAEKSFQPDMVVIATGAWEMVDKVVGTKVYEVGTDEWFTYARSEFEQALKIAGPNGRPIVMLNAPCARSTATVDGPAIPEVMDQRRLDTVNELFAQLAAAHPDQIHLLDLKSLLCPNGTFEPKIDGVEVRPDGAHYSPAGAALVWKWLAPQLNAILGGDARDDTATAPVGGGASPTTKPNAPTTSAKPSLKDGDPQLCAWVKQQQNFAKESKEPFPKVFAEFEASTLAVRSHVPAELQADHATVQKALELVKPSVTSGEVSSSAKFGQWFTRNDVDFLDQLAAAVQRIATYNRAHC
jgi:peptidoglycan/LPS O-acetylase OafA/YrhL